VCVEVGGKGLGVVWGSEACYLAAARLTRLGLCKQVAGLADLLHAMYMVVVCISTRVARGIMSQEGQLL